ncbi:hypothetical protein [uncultured Treponema sp.]|uniref:hypothetical protein n=1 Tax=uncultured Treponema sp. TaxID=162155 RepID=UPI000E7FB331|nr:hypothetical protein [uncultured Treponema sp.]HAZ95990.1 hypothetical protein [Treponema sp.]
MSYKTIRDERFGESANTNGNKSFGKFSLEHGGFFIGEDVKARMNLIRNSILEVRKNWNDKKFRKKAIKLFKNHIGGKSLLFMDFFNDEWYEFQKNPPAEQNCDLIRFYTSSDGYETIFKYMNSIFREEHDKEVYDSAAFLVECMNIELYNLVKTRLEFSNFENTIYRGIMLDENTISNLLDIKELEVQDRKFAVPLSFMSCSKSQDVAKQFLEKQERRPYEEKVRGFCPVLFKIHVTSLDKIFLDLYKSYYPTSIVSSICAVDIENISKYMEEQEVLLRGAFFQVLRFYESKEKIDGKNVYVFELLMHNSNRDHITTSAFEKTNARRLFNTLIEIDRMKKCQDFFESASDKKPYKKVEEDKLKELEQIQKLCHEEKFSSMNL